MAKLKVSGLSNKRDIDAVNQVKPDFAGFELELPDSRHSISIEDAKVLIQGLDKEILPIGILADAPAEVPISLLRDKTFWAVQLMGAEDDTYIEKIQNMTGRPVIKGFRVKSQQQVMEALQCAADYILLEPEGTDFDWSQIPAVRRPFFLSGGVEVQNLRAVIGSLHPWAVDLDENLETEGEKDSGKILQIQRMLKQIEALEAYKKEREADF